MGCAKNTGALTQKIIATPYFFFFLISPFFFPNESLSSKKYRGYFELEG
jgi:hypothetical protein